ncbi:response regulator transcription factor [bacterium]|nr:MAG: response regulator transcription factor [bacterium]
MGRTGKGKVRVILAHEYPLFVEGLRAALEADSRMAVVATAGDGDALSQRAGTSRPDVILVDLNLPGLGGLEALPRLIRAAGKGRVIVLGARAEGGLVREAARCGAKGYLLMDSSPRRLAQAVASVSAGRTDFVMDPEDFPGGPAADLTAREREVLTLVAEGLSSKQIAAELSIGPRTVETHRERLMDKLGVKNAVDLVRSAFARGLVKL